jgi:predicted transcriptional regulator
MSDPVDELEFLSRSRHRIHLLRALREPCDRATLRERTDASKPTVSRALAEFDERGWVRRVGGCYRLTELGELVEAGLDATVRAIATAEKLAPVSAWLPTDRFGFDLALLHDATVLTPSSADALAVHRRLGSALYEADRVRELTGTVAANGIDVHRRGVEEHGQTLEVVLTADALETLRSTPELARSGAAVLELDGVTVFRYDGSCSYFLALADERTLIGVLDETGSLRGLIESTDPAVCRWADGTLDEYRSAATEVTSIHAPE